MAYIDQALLRDDLDFNRRVSACCVEQAEVFRNDARPDFVALANDVLRGNRANDFGRIIASAPGIADKAATDVEDIVDSSKVSDADILTTVQANWQVVTGLPTADDGTPSKPNKKRRAEMPAPRSKTQ